MLTLRVLSIYIHIVVSWQAAVGIFTVCYLCTRHTIPILGNAEKHHILHLRLNTHYRQYIQGIHKCAHVLCMCAEE